MKFALLSDDQACLPLLWAIGESPEDELVVAVCDDAHWRAVKVVAPQARRAVDVRELLLEPGVQAVIVAGISQEVLEGARLLASSGRLEVIYPDARQTGTFAYALWPLEEEGQARLFPVLNHRLDPRWQDLRTRLQAPGVPSLRHLRFERVHRCPQRSLTQSEVERLLLPDADLLRWLVGSYSHLTCLTFGQSEQGPMSASVTLSGNGLPEAEWSLTADADRSACRIEVVTEREVIRAEFAGATGLADAAAPGDDSPDPGRLLLADVHRVLAGAAPGAKWADVVQAFDIVEASRRSLRRKRTVEIGSEAISERREFKSLMSAGGCGVLVFTLLAVIGALVFGALADPRDAAHRRSAAADLIIYEDEFIAATSELTPGGLEHVSGMPQRIWQTTAEVIVEESAGGDTELDAARRKSVIDVLLPHQGPDVEARTVLRPLRGRWFETAMTWIWVAVFAPLGLLLASQLLIVLARPSPAPSRPSE